VETEWEYSGRWEGMEKRKSKKIHEANKKGKKEKILKDRVEGGEVKGQGGRGDCPQYNRVYSTPTYDRTTY